jgi:hypothetical protein
MNLTKRGKKIFFPIFAAALINFAMFIAINLAIGGDAWNGRREADCYFVGRQPRS